MQGFVTDWNRCDFMTFGDKKVAPVIASFDDLENAQLFDDGAEALMTDKDGNKVVASGEGAGQQAGAVYVSEEQDMTLVVVALGISVLSLLVAVGSIIYACMVVKSVQHETNSEASNEKPLKSGV